MYVDDVWLEPIRRAQGFFKSGAADEAPDPMKFEQPPARSVARVREDGHFLPGPLVRKRESLRGPLRAAHPKVSHDG